MDAALLDSVNSSVILLRREDFGRGDRTIADLETVGGVRRDGPDRWPVVEIDRPGSIFKKQDRMAWGHDGSIPGVTKAVAFNPDRFEERGRPSDLELKLLLRNGDESDEKHNVRCAEPVVELGSFFFYCRPGVA